MAKTAQVNGQMELNFTEQKFPKKRSIAKKSVSKPKKEIKKQIAFSSEHYEKAIEIVKEREIIHLGTLMRCLHISAMESDAIIQKMRTHRIGIQILWMKKSIQQIHLMLLWKRQKKNPMKILLLRQNQIMRTNPQKLHRMMTHRIEKFNVLHVEIFPNSVTGS